MKKIFKKGIAVAVASALFVTTAYAGIIVADKTEEKGVDAVETFMDEYSAKYSGEVSYANQLYVWSGDNAFNPKEYLPDGCLFNGETIEYVEGQIDLTPGATSPVVYKITSRNGDSEKVRHEVYAFTAVSSKASSTVRSAKQAEIIYGLTQKEGFSGYLPYDYTLADRSYEAEEELTIVKGSAYYPQHAFMNYDSDEYILSIVGGELKADVPGTYTLTYSVSPIWDGDMNWYENYKINVVDEESENKGMKVVAADNIIHATVRDQNGCESEVFMGNEYNLNAGVKQITVQNKRGYDAYADIEVLKNGKTVNKDDIVKSIDRKEGEYIINFKNRYDYQGYEVRLSNNQVLNDLLAKPDNSVNGGWDDHAGEGIIVDKPANAKSKTFASGILDRVKRLFSTDADAAEVSKASLSLAGCAGKVEATHQSEEYHDGKPTGNKVTDAVYVTFKKGDGGVKSKVSDLLSDKGYRLSNSNDFPGGISLKCGGDHKAAYGALTVGYVTLNAYLIEDGNDVFVRIKGSYHNGDKSYQVLSGEIKVSVEPVKVSLNISKTTDIPNKNQSDSNGIVEGCKFGVYKSESNAKKDKKKVFSLTTDADGMAYATKDQAEKLNAGDSYWVREISAPTGTYLNTTAYKVTMEANKTKTVKIKNPPARVKAQVTKADADDNTKLGGAVFTIYEYDKDDKNYSYEVGKVTTNSSGFADTDWMYYTQSNEGKFLIKETSAPNGYQADANAYKYISIGNSKKDTTVKWTVKNNKNKPKPGYIEVQKVIENPKELDLTATFTVYSDEACFTPVTTITTNANGYGKSGLLPEVRDYWVKETSWNYGMEPADKNAKVKVPSDKTENGQTYRINPDINSKSVGKQERWYAGLEVKKIDEVTGNPLPGAEFTFYEWNGTGYVELEKKISDENGIVQIPVSEKLVRYKKSNQGRFAVKETRAPKGYRIKDTSMHYAVLDVFNKGTVLKFDKYEYSNQPLGYLNINKIITDATGKIVTSEDFSSDALNITYCLYFDEACTNKVPGYERIVLGKDGYFKSEGLVPATYYLREETLNSSYFSNKAKTKAVRADVQPGNTLYLDGEKGRARSKKYFVPGTAGYDALDWDDSIWSN